ncbi:hypothetical protein BofuT4_P035880.1 [Botrytis cinerea T4]|uniref:Uncharacterized protein n=1 Tax=Botryotinia fuckeliana (strain T4) TaxID=999810 RepID=G2Y4L8_BOTF4|nr:hypothetical protein BofuT4_P035880.1 [Botrytis cinerea T4]
MTSFSATRLHARATVPNDGFLTNVLNMALHAFLAFKFLADVGPLIRDPDWKLKSGDLTHPFSVALPLRHFHHTSKDSNGRTFTTVIVTLDGFTGRLSWLDFNVMSDMPHFLAVGAWKGAVPQLCAM